MGKLPSRRVLYQLSEFSVQESSTLLTCLTFLQFIEGFGRKFHICFQHRCIKLFRTALSVGCRMKMNRSPSTPFPSRLFSPFLPLESLSTGCDGFFVNRLAVRLFHFSIRLAFLDHLEEWKIQAIDRADSVVAAKVSQFLK